MRTTTMAPYAFVAEDLLKYGQEFFFRKKKMLNGNKWTRVRCVNYDMSRKTHCCCHFQLFASIVVSKLSWNCVFFSVHCDFLCVCVYVAPFHFDSIVSRMWCIHVLALLILNLKDTMISVKCISLKKYRHNVVWIRDKRLIWTHDCFDYEDYDETQSTRQNERRWMNEWQPF